MNWNREDRAERRCKFNEDQRSCFARDRDRILYSSHFQRLTGITQIVKADEQEVFHNRLTHSIKVAQLGRRISEYICTTQEQDAVFWGIEPEVVEAACLAHDMGHPPFGHVGEMTLNDLVTKGAEPDKEGFETDSCGFEGNAQTLRIISNLAVHHDGYEGLNLTRATLAACIKYPWVQNESGTLKKWGVYKCDMVAFEFAFSKFLNGQKVKTPEAEIMDWADDIAYSIHDLEDCHRCNLIPWHKLFQYANGIVDNKFEKKLLFGDLLTELIQSSLKSWRDKPENAEKRLKEAAERLAGMLVVLDTPYDGKKEQRLQIRQVTSELVGRYVRSIQLVPREEHKLGEPTVVIEPLRSDEVRLLKQITRNNIIQSPALAAQQNGYREVIKFLYVKLYNCLKEDDISIVPAKFSHIIQDSDSTLPRKVADIIASLTEKEAISLHQRLSGISSGSVLDPIVR